MDEIKNEGITLTLDDEPVVETITEEEIKEVEAAKAEAATKFTEEEMKQIKDFAEKIDLTDANAILSYGAASQRKMSDFSDAALSSVRTKDLGDVGELLSTLMVDLKKDTNENKGFFAKLFNKGEVKIEEMRAQYASAEANVDRVVKALEEHRETLTKDIALLDKLYDKNKLYFKELSMYIEAAKIKLDKARNEELPALQKKAAESGLPEDTQEAQDFANMIDRFDKKIYDLEATRAICLQNAPQIRMIQNNDIIMSDKIHSAIVNTIPLWKNQMILTLGLQHTAEAVKAQNMVDETTNEMLKKNAELLHTTTVETAKSAERGIVDIETLQHTNNQLISTLDELIQIQTDGREKRAAAEEELAKIEAELKEKMLAASAVAGGQTVQQVQG
ncbi:MAG: toxic anion resistance protein [Clostridiales bacterium]|nr:toxic anion resistance protein [Candidatus Crickella merdequi]